MSAPKYDAQAVVVERVKALRNARNLSMRGLADGAKMSLRDLVGSLYESRPLGIDEACALADALGVKAYELMCPVSELEKETAQVLEHLGPVEKSTNQLEGVSMSNPTPDSPQYPTDRLKLGEWASLDALQLDVEESFTALFDKFKDVDPRVLQELCNQELTNRKKDLRGEYPRAFYTGPDVLDWAETRGYTVPDEDGNAAPLAGAFTISQFETIAFCWGHSLLETGELTESVKYALALSVYESDKVDANDEIARVLKGTVGTSDRFEEIQVKANHDPGRRPWISLEPMGVDIELDDVLPLLALIMPLWGDLCAMERAFTPVPESGDSK